MQHWNSHILTLSQIKSSIDLSSHILTLIMDFVFFHICYHQIFFSRNFPVACMYQDSGFTFRVVTKVAGLLGL